MLVLFRQDKRIVCGVLDYLDRSSGPVAAEPHIFLMREWNKVVVNYPSVD